MLLDHDTFAAIAAALPGATLNPDTERGFSTIAIDGLTLYQCAGQGVPRGSVGFAAYPSEHSDFVRAHGYTAVQANPRMQINCALSKTPDAMARDIARRLLPVAKERAAVWRENATAFNDREARDAELCRRLAEVPGVQMGSERMGEGRSFYFKRGNVLMSGYVAGGDVIVRRAHGFSVELLAALSAATSAA